MDQFLKRIVFMAQHFGDYDIEDIVKICLEANLKILHVCKDCAKNGSGNSVAIFIAIFVYFYAYKWLESRTSLQKMNAKS